MDHFKFSSRLTLIYQNVSPFGCSAQQISAARHKDHNGAPRLLKSSLNAPTLRPPPHAFKPFLGKFNFTFTFTLISFLHVTVYDSECQ
jgi:hypothetical protein